MFWGASQFVVRHESKYWLLLGCCGVMISTGVLAQDETDYVPEGLSLEDLLEFDGMVVSASKKAESIDTAPAIMSVFTRQNIIDTGAQNLVQALSIMTGIFTYDTYFSQYHLASIRNNFGGEHYLSKILFLINGHPVYSPVNGGAKLTALPIDAVQRVEVVRGPVSVLFGTNALTGVINVITKKPGQQDASQLRLAVGSGDKKKLDLSISQQWQDWRWFLSASVQREEGYLHSVSPQQDEAGIGYDDKRFGEDMTSIFSNLGYADFEMDIFYANAKKDHKYGIIPNSFFAGVDTFDEKMFYLDLRYSQRLSEDVTLNYKLWYDDLAIDWRNDGIFILESGPFGLDSPPHVTDIVSDSNKLGGEIFANVTVSDNWDYSAGIVYAEYQAQPYIFATERSVVSSGISPLSAFTEKKSDTDLALFVNTSYTMSDDLSLTAGFRHTDNETAGEQFNYRAGVIYRINESFVVKGLYATSFRSANLFERYVSSAPILKGNVDLQNEELKGVDIGLYYSGKQSKAAINYYRNSTENFIKRRPVDGVPTYVNLAEGEKTTGLEYEFTHFFSKSLSVFVNGSHSFSAEDGATGDNLKYVLDDLVNFGVTYKYNDKLTISSFNRYRSGWGDAASFSVYNLHLGYQMVLGEYDAKLSLSLDNVFDKTYEYAEFSRGRLATIPGGAPRRFLAAINLAF